MQDALCPKAFASAQKPWIQRALPRGIPDVPRKSNLAWRLEGGAPPHLGLTYRYTYMHRYTQMVNENDPICSEKTSQKECVFQVKKDSGDVG